MENRGLREKILELTAEYARSELLKKTAWREGDKIPYAGRVYDEKEVAALVDCALDFWLTAGKCADRFEKGLANFLGVKHCAAVNSGSSANLLAFMALTSTELGERAVKRGDEVITVAAGFPTTIAPIVQFGAIPVFVDVTIPQYNIDCDMLERALSAKTKAVFIAHTLGNPFDAARVRDFCDRNGLWLIEDNCDALGSRCHIDGEWVLTGQVGDIATSSFYPPHHITTGEGGAVYTSDDVLYRLVISYRDWGRDCVCPSGADNSCGRRHDGQYGELPAGYDHKYVYSHFGYNLKMTDMQSAVGCEQLEKLPGFIEKRKANWEYLRSRLACLSDELILPEKNGDPSWFGFLITVKKPGMRDRAVRYLEDRGVSTRMLFAGNIIRHPCFDGMRREGKGYRVALSLDNTDRIMRDSFWLGVYPGLDEPRLNYIIRLLKEIFTDA